MRVLLLSDTHSFFDPNWEKYAVTCDEIWHAGDIGDLKVTDQLRNWKPIKAVYGNIDGASIRSEFPEYIIFSADGVKVLMIHIGGYPNHFSPQSRKLIQAHKPDLFICGHSHILRVIYDKKLNLLTMNPGAAGMTGFHTIRTMLRFSLIDGRITDAEVIELKAREKKISH